MSESIIQVQHLNKTFGTGDTAVHALEDINLDIKQGEIFGIIGLSGAGKSTLVRCMNLLERPTSGTVIVDGKEMTALSEKELRLARRPGKNAGGGAAGARWSGRQGRRLSLPALRRSEAAGCHRPCSGNRPQGPAV